MNLTYEAPALFARRFSTLDHLTDGRIGWNIVTGYLDSAARAMGLPAQLAHDDRYDAAEQFMATVYGLWEGSWADDAVLRDRATGVYADPREGPRHPLAARIEAIHLCEPSPQRTPVLYQAGASDRGRDFAARHAECVFLNAVQPGERARGSSADLRAKAAPRPLRIFVGATLILGRTEAEARDLLAEYRRPCQHRAARWRMPRPRSGSTSTASGWTSRSRPPAADAISSNVEAMARVFGPGWTKRHADRPVHPRQPAAADRRQRRARWPRQLIAFAEAADVDGFNLSRTVMPECIEAVVDLLVPALQARGAYKPPMRRGPTGKSCSAPARCWPRPIRRQPHAVERQKAEDPSVFSAPHHELRQDMRRRPGASCCRVGPPGGLPLPPGGPTFMARLDSQIGRPRSPPPGET